MGGAITTAPDMQRWLVGEHGWISDAQFTTSVAIAQAAPGPNMLFVAVIGWKVAGVAGVVATLAGHHAAVVAAGAGGGRFGQRRGASRAHARLHRRPDAADAGPAAVHRLDPDRARAPQPGRDAAGARHRADAAADQAQPDLAGGRRRGGGRLRLGQRESAPAAAAMRGPARQSRTRNCSP